ncbi:VOC family protein [Chloroflexota bacterium]
MENKKIVGNIDHIVFAVRDAKKAIDFFSELLNTEFFEQLSQEQAEETGFRSFMSPGGVEILEPSRPDSDLQKFLDKKGEGMYAIGFNVQDAGKAKARAEKMGIRIAGDVSIPMNAGPAGEFLVREIWLHPKDCFGVYSMFTQGNPYHP